MHVQGMENEKLRLEQHLCSTLCFAYNFCIQELIQPKLSMQTELSTTDKHGGKKAIDFSVQKMYQHGHLLFYSPALIWLVKGQHG